MGDRGRVVITGGHHNSALVVAEELRSRGYEVIWFGHKYTMKGAKKPGAEYEEVIQSGFKFVEIKAGKFYRTLDLSNFVRLPFGFIQALYQLLKYRPKLIISFGGYLAVPVVIWGWYLRIPTITHEQTVVYGLANRLISLFAKKILVSWEASLRHFPEKKVIFTGLPLRACIFRGDKKKLSFKNELPTIYITGGKQGSHIINEVVAQSLPLLLEKCNIIHQCGGASEYDDFSHLSKIRELLSPKLKARYILREYIFQDEIGDVFATADLVVGRSGAHITYEMAALGKPSLFIPIPWSYANEQYENARILQKVGIAEILAQSALSGESFVSTINKMLGNLSAYRKNAKTTAGLVKLDAGRRIADLVDEITHAKGS
jgi:UDP-N-acetylglucosamine--N-acetylmuramyl-(pentapeptide) pyrophosphoryl-undecaprenol N-acetylglucosamine transferase